MLIKCMHQLLISQSQNDIKDEYYTERTVLLKYLKLQHTNLKKIWLICQNDSIKIFGNN